MNIYTNKVLLITTIIFKVCIETKISTLESNINDQLKIYAFLTLFSYILSFVNNYNIWLYSKNESIIFKNEQLIKYENLDDTSKEKDTIESFCNKLDKSCHVISMKCSWGLNVFTSLISCIISLSVIFIINKEFLLLLLFIVINICWFKFIMYNEIVKLDSLRTIYRKKRHILYENIKLLYNRFYLGECNSNKIIDKENILINESFLLDSTWNYVIILQQVPNLICLFCVAFLLFDTVKYQMIIIIFIKIKNVVSNTSHFLNEWKTMENDIKAISDFFEGKTSKIKSIQYDIPITLSFNVNNKIKSDNIIINQGDRIILSGDTGCGKTTLIKALMGYIDGVTYDSNKPSDSYNDKIAYMRQNIREKTPTAKITIRQLFNEEPDDDLIIKLIEYAENKKWFNDIMKRQLDIPIGEICQISGGEKTRLCFALTLYQLEKRNCQWLILDEPEQGLDPDLCPIMLNKTFELYKNITIIMITHMCKCRLGDLSITKIWKIEQGKLICY